MQLIPVPVDEVPNFREGRRGRVSYPILKMFLESGNPMVKIDRTGMQQSFQSLYSSIRAYIESHNLPVRIFSRGGEIYLVRTDTEGEVAKLGVSEKAAGINVAPVAITPDEVARRFEEEKGNAGK